MADSIDRRDFFKGAALGAAGLVVTTEKTADAAVIPAPSRVALPTTADAHDLAYAQAQSTVTTPPRAATTQGRPASDFMVDVIKKIGFAVPGVRPELLQPVGMEFTKDGKYLFVALGPANRVAVVDPKTYEVLDYILVGQRPWHLELSPDHGKLYVANGLTNDMTIIDVASLKAEKSVPVGRLPWGIAVIP